MKAARVILLAGIPLCWMSLASGRALAGNAASAWSGLWRTPDQQGQALLDAGNPAEAASRFHDPRLRAYADLQAEHNQEAAKLLQPFSDAQSEYNRGNALAKAGQLQDALAAYDAALKQTPADRDIRHNRDLVAHALQQQQKSQSSPNGGQNGRKSGSSGQQQNSGAGQRQGSGSQQSSAGGQRSSGGSQGSSNVAQGGGVSPGSSGQQQSGASSGTSKEAPGQAQRDAAEAAAVARERQGKTTGNNGEATASARAGAPRPGSRNGDKGQAPGMQTPRQQPETEKQLALDQWLRQIPDSPAGLLQRKFLIEHMMKQQGGDEPPDSGP